MKGKPCYGHDADTGIRECRSSERFVSRTFIPGRVAAGAELDKSYKYKNKSKGSTRRA
jgi:hypothetical protein